MKMLIIRQLAIFIIPLYIDIEDIKDIKDIKDIEYINIKNNSSSTSNKKNSGEFFPKKTRSLF